MFKKISDFIKNLPVPNIYFVFPNRGKDRVKKRKREIYVPQEPALIVDTSALIDGRIADIVSTGFVSGTFIVPSYVINELQQVADSKNPQKRKRGRRGLDVLNEIKKCKYIKFKVIRMGLEAKTVDESLLILAKKLKGRIITTDFNLNKVSRLTGVPILNVNELANMVRAIYLPGEKLEIKLLQEGKEKGQAVGYLPDGTMVVVKNANKLIGEDVDVVVKRLLQTNAGRMVFAELDG